MSMNQGVRCINPTIGIFLLFAVSVPCHAALLTWTLHDVTLQEADNSVDPGHRFSASGSFVYDAQTRLVTNWNILVDSESTRFAPDVPCSLPGCTNTAERFPGPDPGTDEFLFEHLDASAGGSPDFTLITPLLTDSGGTKPVIGGSYARGGGALYSPT
jgi:hypothetical protein